MSKESLLYPEENGVSHFNIHYILALPVDAELPSLDNLCESESGYVSLLSKTQPQISVLNVNPRQAPCFSSDQRTYPLLMPLSAMCTKKSHKSKFSQT